MTSMAAPAALPDAEWSECLLPAGPVPREMAREVRRAVGALPGWVPRLAPSPGIVRAFRDTIQRPAAYLPRTFFDLGAVVVSQDNSCRYCYGAQRAVMKVLGYRDEYLDRLVRDFHVVDLPPGERAGLDYLRRLSRADPRPGRAESEAVVQAGLDRRSARSTTASRPSWRCRPTRSSPSSGVRSSASSARSWPGVCARAPVRPSRRRSRTTVRSPRSSPPSGTRPRPASCDA